MHSCPMEVRVLGALTLDDGRIRAEPPARSRGAGCAHRPPRCISVGRIPRGGPLGRGSARLVVEGHSGVHHAAAPAHRAGADRDHPTSGTDWPRRTSRSTPSVSSDSSRRARSSSSSVSPNGPPTRSRRRSTCGGARRSWSSPTGSLRRSPLVVWRRDVSVGRRCSWTRGSRRVRSGEVAALARARVAEPRRASGAGSC